MVVDVKEVFMNLKKLSVAAALSVGIMTLGGLAQADQTGAAAPVCPPPKKEMPCPMPVDPCPCPTGAAVPVCPQVCVPQVNRVVEVFSPMAQSVAMPECPGGAAPVNEPIATCLPNCAPCPEIINRQAYEYPDIGGSSLVFPKGNDIVQIGGDDEALAVNSGCIPGTACVPGCGALSVVPRNLSNDFGDLGLNGGMNYTGAAAGLCPGAPAAVQVSQGTEIFRCEIPTQRNPINSLLQASACDPCAPMGAAAPICPVDPCNPCAPMGAAAPVYSAPIGGAAPVYYNAPMGVAPVYSAPTGAASPIMPTVPAGSYTMPSTQVPQSQFFNFPGNLNLPLGSADITEDENIIPVSDGYMAPCPPPAGAACPIPAPACPVDPCDPCAPMGAAAPICPVPMGAACPVSPCDPCGTGMAAPAGNPRTIQTSSGLQIQRTALVPVQVPTGAACPVCPECPTPCPTGGACPVQSQFPDVTNNAMSGCDISKLAAKGILAGYPDRTYKPCLPIMRDEMASALVSGLEIKDVPDFQQQIFADVPLGHWANADIDKAYNRGLMAGYPNCTFKPDQAVSRAEALSIMAKAIPGELTTGEAQQVLSMYPDANQVPDWAALSVAEALNAGLIQDLANNNMIKPNASASRAEVASMIENLREVLALEPAAQPTGAATELQPQIVTSTIPTLKMKFNDIVSARTSEVDDRITANTTEAVNIDGMFFPAGTIVRGKVAEVIRPGLGESGAIRVEFTTIGGDGCQTDLPNEILSATVIEEDTPNIFGRLFAWPFSWPGKVAGVATRTVGGTAIIAGNMVETFLTNIANGNNELFQGEFGGAGRSYYRAGADIVEGVYDTTVTAFSGTFGVLKVTGDEVAYLVAGDGSRVAQINPNETLSVAFGCR